MRNAAFWMKTVNAVIYHLIYVVHYCSFLNSNKQVQELNFWAKCVYFTSSKSCDRSSADACTIVAPSVTSWAMPDNFINWNRHSRKTHWGSHGQAESQICVASERQRVKKRKTRRERDWHRWICTSLLLLKVFANKTVSTSYLILADGDESESQMWLV